MDKKELIKLIYEDDDVKTAILSVLKVDEPKDDLIKDKEEIKVLKALVEKFKKCFSDEEAKNSTLTKDLSELKKEKEDLVNSNENLKSKNKELKKDLEKIESSNTQLNKTIEFYRDNFEDELTAYELFTSLSDDTKSSIDGIFKDVTLKGFVSCGVQDKNISSFWDYIKTELQEDKNQDIKKLIKIYEFLFESYVRAFPMYESQKVQIGDEFDSHTHINHSSSGLVSGNITKVLLKGYINTKTSKIIKQSVVKVG